jgi:hypothetical protein
MERLGQLGIMVNSCFTLDQRSDVLTQGEESIGSDYLLLRLLSLLVDPFVSNSMGRWPLRACHPADFEISGNVCLFVEDRDDVDLVVVVGTYLLLQI